MSSSSLCSFASCRPATSFSYSFCSFSASVRLILRVSSICFWKSGSVLLDFITNFVDTPRSGLQHGSRQID